MEMNIPQLVGFLCTLVLLIGLSIYSGKKAKGTSFTGNKNSNATIVAGMIIGTIVGGSSTIGTAQLAYHYGFSAWWFTLGAGLGCLLLGLFFVKPFRQQNSLTVTGMITEAYGPQVGLAATLLSSIGIFINIIAQIMAATTIIAIFFPNLSLLSMAIVAALLMISYVIFGGVTGAGMVGVLKTVLLYMASVGGGCLALYLTGGFSSLYENPILEHSKYFHLFARGVGTDLGAVLSLLVGVLSTQTYIQAILVAKNDREAMKGAFISAAFVPPIGIGGIMIGLFMRVNYPDLASAKYAFPVFVMNHMPSVLAGVVIAGLLIVAVGTGAGLALGISTIIQRDLIDRFFKERTEKIGKQTIARILIILVLMTASLFATGKLGDLILGFSFMSMGLRGAVLFLPLMCILFLKVKIKANYAMASVIMGPVAVLLGNFIIHGFDPLFIGLGLNTIIMMIGLYKSKNLDRR